MNTARRDTVCLEKEYILKDSTRVVILAIATALRIYPVVLERFNKGCNSIYNCCL